MAPSRKVDMFVVCNNNVILCYKNHVLATCISVNLRSFLTVYLLLEWQSETRNMAYLPTAGAGAGSGAGAGAGVYYY